MLPRFKGIDFETYCEEDIRAKGIYNYTSHPSFRPILVSVAVGVPWRQTISFDLTDEDGRAGFIRQVNYSIKHGHAFAAHNADFERLCCEYFGLNPTIIDTAVICRANGASSSLGSATVQLGVGRKLPEGKDLIKKFCTPRKDGTALVDHREDWTQEDWDDWTTFVRYCDDDASSAYALAANRSLMTPELYEELTKYAPLTTMMNRRGWPVDLALVETFEQRAKENKEQALEDFRTFYDPLAELNLNSHVQLKKWCKERGVLATSFDEQHVASMLDRIEKRLTNFKNASPSPQLAKLFPVRGMLRTKQIIGGSSLKKLPVIKRLVSEDGRLRGQYMHVGAGQSYRTSGTGAQMQNLPRLHGVPGNVAQAHTWTNDQLAHNLRQCFTASHPDGALIVGDLSSIESRGLAYLAGERWKTEAYAQGKDLYMVLASNIYGVDYGLIVKDQRQTGKVGELSCGYGAGAGAVKSFADKMGVQLSEEAASKLVFDWRAQCPKTVELWEKLDQLMHDALKNRCPTRTTIGIGTYNEHLVAEIVPVVTPQSLRSINPHGDSLRLNLYVDGDLYLSRIFHGCYYRDQDVCYYKATDRKSGPLWSDTYRNPKTKQLAYNKLYGGKLTGILVQSFCRQLFFEGMLRVQKKECEGFELIGQFHDELIVDWWEADLSLEEAKSRLQHCMTDEPRFKELPIEAEVKAAYRYIK